LGDPAPPVAGLVLDLCGVLYADTAWQRWLLRLLSHFGVHASYTAFARLWQCEMDRSLKTGQKDLWRAVRDFLRSTGLTSGQIDQVEAAGRAQWHRLQEDIHPLPGVVNTLRQLDQRGTPLALLCTGWLSRVAIEQRLDRLHLRGTFRCVLCERELAERNPDENIFRAVSDALRVAVWQLAYVGRDSTTLASASAAGLRAIAFNHDRDALADGYLDTFSDLLQLLRWQPARLLAG
jgi:beta-phosphoglucomutase-like phosphatase (HAD superfamily)